MKPGRVILLNVFLFLVTALVVLSTTPGFTQVKPSIVGPLDNTARVTLKGNVHRLARQEFDRGPAPRDLAMDRMLLVLKRSPEQEAALRKLLDDQQDKASPHYRKWLTPEEFGREFGPAEGDVQTITEWLRGQGFHDVLVNKGRTLIEFSGTAGQVQDSLGASMRRYTVQGKDHWANANNPTIPAALTPAVEGVWTLHSFYKESFAHVSNQLYTAKAVPGQHPQFSSSSGQHALTPADYYTIYNINPLVSWSSKIAIVGRSNINPQDVVYFHYWLADQAMSAQVVVNGPDPGDLGGDEELEAVLDTTWAGAVSPTSLVQLVVSRSTATTDGVDLSEAYIIDNNLADVMSESFGSCEANFTSTEAAGISSLAQQAAAQGITYVVATGDSGSAGCDDPNKQTTATHGLSVNMLASTPFTVAVGGTIFFENGNNGAYWRSTNTQPTQGSAISYIPEKVWNQSCSSGQSGCTKPNIAAGGGGASAFFSKPSWQIGVPGIPSDNVRHLPDVSLTAATHDPYLLCLQGSCVPDANGKISFFGVGGTSASTPAFAGVMSLVTQKQLVRLGQPNYVLYKLAASEKLSQCNGSNATLPLSTCVFNDVTLGNNAVPGEVNYGTAGATYQASQGYDQATGLGSVNVTNLIDQWSTVSFSPTTTTFSMSPTSAVHGSPIHVSGTVAANSGTGIPTGPVWVSLYQGGNIVGDGTVNIFPLDNLGSYSGVTHVLPGGTYQVYAHYAGDGSYNGSDSTPAVWITVQPEPTSLSFSVLTKDAGGNLIPFTGGPYGTPLYFKAHISTQSGYGTPGMWVNFYDSDSSFGVGATPDANGDALSPAVTSINAGPHSITASYYGDNSFSPSSDMTPVKFTITGLPTNTVLTSEQTARYLTLTATVSASGSGSAATGSVTFSSGGKTLATAFLSNGSTANGTTQATATFDATQLPAGQYRITANYAGDTNYTASSSSPLALNLAADFTVANLGIASQTVAAGGTASYVNDIGVNPFFGFTGTVSVSCSVPAQGTTCVVDPNSYILSSGIMVGTLSVTTTSRLRASIEPSRSPFSAAPLVLSSSLALFLSTLLVPSWRVRRSRLIGLLILFAVLSCLLVACGGGSSGGGGGGGTNPNGTAAGTYPVTVTATSGTVTHTTSLSMIVQ